jgi:hypothetical protein
MIEKRERERPAREAFRLPVSDFRQKTDDTAFFFAKGSAPFFLPEITHLGMI